MLTSEQTAPGIKALLTLADLTIDTDQKKTKKKQTNKKKACGCLRGVCMFRKKKAFCACAVC